jgi:hypothetical protein
MNSARAFVERAMNAVTRAFDTLEVDEPERAVHTETIENELWLETGNERYMEPNDEQAL